MQRAVQRAGADGCAYARWGHQALRLTLFEHGAGKRPPIQGMVNRVGLREGSILAKGPNPPEDVTLQGEVTLTEGMTSQVDMTLPEDKTLPKDATRPNTVTFPKAITPPYPATVTQAVTPALRRGHVFIKR